mgnify:CR=1 FL=1
MNRKTLPTLVALMAALLTAACHPDNPQPTDPPVADADRIAYVLSEGQWGMNNAEITLIDLATGKVLTDFTEANRRGLGDIAQDLQHYGGKLYCTVWNSNTLEVIDPSDGKSIRQIDFGSRGPRFMACHDGKVYVSCYDKSVVRIDTATLAIDATCPLGGMLPEQLAFVGDRLVVCNSWQYAADGATMLYDSTLSVVDCTEGHFAEVQRIAVGVNPTRICAVDGHRCVVYCNGNYGDAPAQTLLFDIATLQRTPLPHNATGMTLHDGALYHYSTDYDSLWRPVARFYRTDLATLLSEPILTATALPYAYGIGVDPATGDILVCNSPYNATGDVYCYTPDGSLRWRAEAGMFCQKVTF